MFSVCNTFNILFTRLLSAKAIQSQSELGGIVLHRRIKACTAAGSAASQPLLKLSTSKQSWGIRGIPASFQIRAKFHLVAQPHRVNGLSFSHLIAVRLAILSITQLGAWIYSGCCLPAFLMAIFVFAADTFVLPVCHFLNGCIKVLNWPIVHAQAHRSKLSKSFHV